MDHDHDMPAPPGFADWDEAMIGIAMELVMIRSDVDENEACHLLLAACDRTGKTLPAVSRAYVETGQV